MALVPGPVVLVADASVARDLVRSLGLLEREERRRGVMRLRPATVEALKELEVVAGLRNLRNHDTQDIGTVGLRGFEPPTS